MIELYIRGKKADLTGDESILFNKTRTDYTNPAIVKNAFTKTVSLPGTVVNDAIFEHIYIPCKSISSTSAFNPSKRTSFVLLRDGVVIEEGYLKLDKISVRYATHSYECTLYGELGNILYGLSYKTDSLTGAQVEMTLSDIVWGYHTVPITKDLVKACWNEDYSNYPHEIISALSFAVCYDGVPTANNFDPKKIWTSVDRRANVVYNNKQYHLSMPQGFTDEETYYGYINTKFTDDDTDNGHYGLIELTDGAMPIEVRDLRSYLLRPLLKLTYILNQIGSYMSSNLGYTLDMSDIYLTEDIYNSYVTLPMLTEIYEDVESGTDINLREILKSTSTPTSYLISICKTFGIYMDVDVANKKLHLTPIRSFFNRKALYPNQNPTSIKDIIVDKSNTVSIKPLSFDKSSYTFDYGDSTGELIDLYNSKYTTPFGSQKVNTGYTLDYSTEKYIQNNIFKTAPDINEQSGWYRYHELRDKMLQNTNTPVSVMAEINTPTFKLFNVDSDTHIPVFGEDGECDSFDAPLYRYNKYTPTDNSWGYMYPDNLDVPSRMWYGMTRGTWIDSYPRLQLHDSSRKPIDGANIIVKRQFYLGDSISVTGSFVTDRTTGKETINNYTSTYYILSDDIPNLKSVIGKNCYLDNPTATEYSEIITGFPLFNRIDLVRTNYSSDYYIWDFTSTLDFNYPQEIYIPSQIYDRVPSSLHGSVYERYWSNLVSDIYDINTRVLSANCKVDKIEDAFKQFYVYDNCTWILSKVSDYNIETGIGKFDFTKVSDVSNYVYEDGLYFEQNHFGIKRKQAYTFVFRMTSYGDGKPSIRYVPSWMYRTSINKRRGDDSIKKYEWEFNAEIKENTAGFTRTGQIIIEFNNKTYYVYVKQFTN